MKVRRADNLLKYLIGAKLIGVGTTSMCFLMTNGKVIKIFLETAHKKDLFRKKEMFNQLDMLSRLKTEHYIGPEEVLIKKGHIVAYIMDYVPGKTIDRMDKELKVSEIVEACKRLEEDTYKISEQEFLLSDLHGKNIMFNDCFNVIDLDNGSFSDYYEDGCIMKYNMQDLLDQIIHSIMGISDKKDIIFLNSEINNLYNSVIYREYQEYVAFLKSLSKVVKEDNPTIGELQKNRSLLLRTKKHEEYCEKGFY